MRLVDLSLGLQEIRFLLIQCISFFIHLLCLGYQGLLFAGRLYTLVLTLLIRIGEREAPISGSCHLVLRVVGIIFLHSGVLAVDEGLQVLTLRNLQQIVDKQPTSQLPLIRELVGGRYVNQYLRVVVIRSGVDGAEIGLVYYDTRDLSLLNFRSLNEHRLALFLRLFWMIAISVADLFLSGGEYPELLPRLL